MKKIFAVVVLLACLLQITVSCSKKDGEQSTLPTPTEKPTEPQIPDQKEELALNILDDGYRNWYQIYVYGFYDSDGDGVGDINGVTQKLDYIKDMGYNGIWLMPVMPSEMYHGRDVQSFCDIADELGDTDDFDSLIKTAHTKGIDVLIDLGLNTTSTEHPYFAGAVDFILENGAVGGEYGDCYSFSTEADGNISGSDYGYETSDGLPKINLDSELWRSEITNVMRYWLEERGVDGFRLTDTVKYYFDDDKNIEFLTWFNSKAKEISPECYILGELFINDNKTVAKYYASGIDSFQLFSYADATGMLAHYLRISSGEMLGKLMEDSQTVFEKNITTTFLSGNSLSNRPATYTSSGVASIKMLAGIQMVCSGSISTFYGDEIGMVSKGGVNNDASKYIGIKWTDSLSDEGYCDVATNGAENSYIYASVQRQQNDPNSILNFYKGMLRLRNAFPSLARGKVDNIELIGNTSVCVIQKTYGDEKITVIVNLARPTDPQDVSTGAREVTLDKKVLGYSDIAAQICAYDISYEAEYNSEMDMLVMPPYSIVIMK